MVDVRRFMASSREPLERDNTFSGDTCDNARYLEPCLDRRLGVGTDCNHRRMAFLQRQGFCTRQKARTLVVESDFCRTLLD